MGPRDDVALPQKTEDVNLPRVLRFYVVPMSLKFPNARLHVHDLLSNSGLTGPAAIARSACEYGLINDDELIEVNDVIEEQEFCLCLMAARHVLASYFAKRAGMPDLPAIDFDDVWEAVVKDAEKYKLKMQAHRQDNCVCTSKTGECQRFAPALFDIMLQHIRRYP